MTDHDVEGRPDVFDLAVADFGTPGATANDFDFGTLDAKVDIANRHAKEASDLKLQRKL